MPPQTDALEPGGSIVEQAAAWQAELADEQWSEAGRPALDAWLAADPAHRIAFERMGAIAGRMAGRDAVERTALHRMFPKRAHRTGLVAVLLLAGCAGALGWVGAGNPVLRTPFADQRSAVGELKPVTMATGDALVLDTDSAADLDEGRRAVKLWRGGVMASVRHGASQAFVVRTPNGSARALGTRFSVRIADGATIVTVIESRVEACAAGGRHNCLILRPGEAARLDGAGARLLPRVDPAAAGAWSEGLLVADDTPLAAVLDQLNRYRELPIRYSPDELEGLRVSGTFPLTDADRALASIRAALPVTIETGPGGESVHRR